MFFSERTSLPLMTIYPDAINVVKAQRRISEFTTPDEFASRNSRNGRA